MIAFDIDGVLYDYHAMAYAWVVQNFGVREDFNDFWIGTVHSGSGLNDEQLAELWLEPTLYNKLGCTYAPVVQQVVKDLGGVIYMTRRDTSLTQLTAGWLLGSGLPQGGLLVDPELQKGAWCQAFDIDFIVEDRPDLFEYNNGRTKVIGVRKPWNEELGGRVDYWIDDLWQLPKAIRYLKRA